MKPSNIQANQLDELIVAVKQVSDSIDSLGSDIRSIASAIDQADSYTNIRTIAEEVGAIASGVGGLDSELRDIASEIRDNNAHGNIETIAEKLSDIAESLDYIAATKPDREV